MEFYWYIVIVVWVVLVYGMLVGRMLWPEPRSIAQRNDSSRNDIVAIEMMTIATVDAAIVLDMSI